MATGQVSARRAVNEYLDWDPLVREALEKGAAVVALESTVVAHGLPYPDNLETAREMREAVRSGGATPAIVGIVEGRIRIGLDDLQLERFATDPEVAKASSRDLPVLLSQAAWGATTVAGTVACAAIAGISVFATGGLGGVHRGVEHTFDISADLRELARSPVAVVCSGAKSILDLPKTTEVLETEGVPVIGYRTDRLPAFYSRDSGLELDARVRRRSRAGATGQLNAPIGPRRPGDCQSGTGSRGHRVAHPGGLGGGGPQRSRAPPHYRQGTHPLPARTTPRPQRW